MGNTCYMNAVIQTLLHNKILQQYFATREFKNCLISNVLMKLSARKKTDTRFVPYDGNISASDKPLVEREIYVTMTYQLYRLLMSTKSDPRARKRIEQIEPRTFKQFLSAKNDTFVGYSQNDSHELLMFLLDTIHEETKCTVELCFPSFPPEYHTVEKIKKDILRLINSTNDLNEKIDYMLKYYKYEMTHQHEITVHHGISYWGTYVEKNFSIISRHFTGVCHSSVQCKNCKHITHTFDVFTSISLELPEQSLCHNLYDCLSSFTSKEEIKDEYNCQHCNLTTSCDKKITFWNTPDVCIIHLKRFEMKRSPQGNITIQKKCNMIEYPSVLDMIPYMCEHNKKRMTYKLTSVIHHYGSYNSGHYVSFSDIDGVWYQFNDSVVSKVSDVKEQIHTDASYILVYEKV